MWWSWMQPVLHCSELLSCSSIIKPDWTGPDFLHSCCHAAWEVSCTDVSAVGSSPAWESDSGAGLEVCRSTGSGGVWVCGFSGSCLFAAAAQIGIIIDLNPRGSDGSGSGGPTSRQRLLLLLWRAALSQLVSASFRWLQTVCATFPPNSQWDPTTEADLLHLFSPGGAADMDRCAFGSGFLRIALIWVVQFGAFAQNGKWIKTLCAAQHPAAGEQDTTPAHD